MKKQYKEYLGKNKNKFILWEMSDQIFWGVVVLVY